MRQMINEHGTTVNVIEHIILSNLWEYYIIADDSITHTPDTDITFALVVGEHTELGNVSIDEITPYIVSRTTNLDIMPAPNWRWHTRSVRPEWAALPWTE